MQRIFKCHHDLKDMEFYNRIYASKKISVLELTLVLPTYPESVLLRTYLANTQSDWSVCVQTLKCLCAAVQMINVIT